MMLKLSSGNNLNPPLWQGLAAIFIISVATILGALAFEYIGKYDPCYLCYLERIPYYIAIVLSVLLMVLLVWPRTVGVVFWGMVLMGFIMLFSAGFGAYHAGIEWKLWPGPISCTSVSGAIDYTAGELFERFINQDIRVVPCDAASWRMFGLSFAGWNAVISLVMAFIAVLSCVKSRKYQE